MFFGNMQLRNNVLPIAESRNLSTTKKRNAFRSYLFFEYALT